MKWFVVSCLLMMALPSSHQQILTGTMTEFEGDANIRILIGMPESDRVFLGGNETIYIYDGSNRIDVKDIGACYDRGQFGCRTTDTNEDDCHNFIRGVTILNETCTEPDGSSCKKLYFSGTNALKPTNFFCTYTPGSPGSLSCNFTPTNFSASVDEDKCDESPENIDATDAFQRLKEDNATFLFHDNRIFFGVKETKNDPNAMVGVMDVDPEFGVLSSRVRTRSDSLNQINKDAEFVGLPFWDGDYTFLLFRETALEYESLFEGQDEVASTAIYSRIARVCSNDEGTSASGTTWTSFLKQRLVCSKETNDEGFYQVYDEIQDFVLVKEDNHTIIYGVFNNPRVETDAASAICKFYLANISDTFQGGTFYGSSGSVANDAWREYDGVVNPRPGLNCSDPNTGQTDFLRDYSTLKPDAVSEAECIYDGDRFSNIRTQDDGIFIISSEAGCFYRYTPGMCSFDESNRVCVSDKPIKDIDLVNDNNLMVVTEEGAFTLLLTESDSKIDLFPDDGTVMVAPNTEFVTLAKCSAPPCIVTCELQASQDRLNASLLKQQYLDADETILQYFVRVISETVTCTVTDNSMGMVTIEINTYQSYTTSQCDSREYEWTLYNATHTELNQTDTCGSATDTNVGNFSSMILSDGHPAIKECMECNYADCATDSCPLA